MKRIYYFIFIFILSLNFFNCINKLKENNTGLFALTLKRISATLGLSSNNNGGNSVDSTAVKGTAAGNSFVTPGAVVVQKVILQVGKEFRAKYAAKQSAQTEILKSILGQTSDSSLISLEVYLLDADGLQVLYARSDSSGNVEIVYTPPSTAKNLTYTISIKNNSTINIAINKTEASGGEFVGTMDNAIIDAPLGKFVLRGFVNFSSTCAKNTTVQNGIYYPNILVSLGNVDLATKKVTGRSTATISITDGANTISLKKLDEVTLNASFTTEQKQGYINYLKLMYGSLYGMVGEVYRTDTCSSATSLNLGADPGANQNISLRIQDASIGLDKTIKIKPSISGNLAMYENDGTTAIYSNMNSACSYTNTPSTNYAKNVMDSASTSVTTYTDSGFQIKTLSVTGLPSAPTSTTTATSTSTTTATSTSSGTGTSALAIPEITSISITPASVAGGQTVTVTISATNTNYANVYLNPPDFSNGYGGSKSIYVSMNSLGNGSFSGSATINNYVASGTWKIQNIYLSSSNNVSANYLYNTFISGSYYSYNANYYDSVSGASSSLVNTTTSSIPLVFFEVTGTTPDLSAPIITAINLPSASFNYTTAAPSYTLTVDTSETGGSGLNYVNVNFRLKNSIYSSNIYGSSSIPDANGRVTIVINFNSSNYSGDYELYNININDKAGNSSNYIIVTCNEYSKSSPPQTKAISETKRIICILGSHNRKRSDPGFLYRKFSIKGIL